MNTKKKSSKKTLEQLTKKELIALVVKVRPKADAYDRVCESLGIKNNILSHLKSGEKTFNVNNHIKVKLTEKGFTQWRNYHEKYRTNDRIKKIIPETKIEELKAKRDNKGYNSIQLWEVMEIFGEDFQVNDYFELNVKINTSDLK